MHISKWCLSIWVYIKIREGEISYVPVFAPPIERQSINPLSWKLEPSSKTPHLLITYCYCIVLTFVGTFSASSHTSALPLKSKSTASLERVHSLTQNQINVTFSDTESISCILFIKFRSYILEIEILGAKDCQLYVDAPTVWTMPVLGIISLVYSWVLRTE